MAINKKFRGRNRFIGEELENALHGNNIERDDDFP
jgi:hypothetical protein